MDFYEAVNRRRTIRDFSSQEVSPEIVKRVLEAGMKAPSNDHLRNWEFVVVDGKDVIESIIKKIPNNADADQQLRVFLESRQLDDCQQKMYSDAIPKQYRMLCESGCLILPFYKQNGHLLQPKSLSALNAFASIWCCVENILLAAAAEGLACALRIPIGDEADYVAEYVHAPQGYVMPCYLSIGYPADHAVLNEQEAVNIDARIHLNGW